jgi:hypothetical protein
MRQMAAVELRKRSVKWWPKVDSAMQATVKQSLIDLALREPEYAADTISYDETNGEGNAFVTRSRASFP